MLYTPINHYNIHKIIYHIQDHISNDFQNSELKIFKICLSENFHIHFQKLFFLSLLSNIILKHTSCMILTTHYTITDNTPTTYSTTLNHLSPSLTSSTPAVTTRKWKNLYHINSKNKERMKCYIINNITDLKNKGLISADRKTSLLSCLQYHVSYLSRLQRIYLA